MHRSATVHLSGLTLKPLTAPSQLMWVYVCDCKAKTDTDDLCEMLTAVDDSLHNIKRIHLKEHKATHSLHAKIPLALSVSLSFCSHLVTSFASQGLIHLGIRLSMPRIFWERGYVCKQQPWLYCMPALPEWHLWITYRELPVYSTYNYKINTVYV